MTRKNLNELVIRHDERIKALEHSVTAMVRTASKIYIAVFVGVLTLIGNIIVTIFEKVVGKI